MKELTEARVKQLLEEIKTYERMLDEYDNDPRSLDMVSTAWATLAIAKAKLTSLWEGHNGKESK